MEVSTSGRAGVNYTGHPFVDIGIAAITAHSHKRYPHELSAQDLDAAAEFVEHEYVKPPLRGYLTMAFTSNAWFVQDAFNPEKPGLSPEQRTAREAIRADWAARHLKQWDAEESTSAETCVFTGSPAVAVALSGKLPTSRAGRSQLPLLQGDDAINFFPGGDSGLPISGIALLALQFFPLACAKCGVGMLAVHSDNPGITFRISRRYLNETLRAVALAQAAGETKLVGSTRAVKTLLVESLMEAERERQREGEGGTPASITAYNFNNGKSAQLQIYYLPLDIVAFLRAAGTPAYQAAWQRIVQRGWQRVAGVKAGQLPEQPRHNYLYDDLFTLPESAARFVRTYFLRIPRRSRFEDDPRSSYALRSELDLVSWSLVELFLGKVVHVDESRLAQIRSLGDALANYVRRQGGGGKRFFRSFFTENNAANFRALLINANKRNISEGQPALFDLDSYVDVFEEGFEVMRPDWRFARDLVLMRMIDQLKDWLAQNPEAAPEIGPEAEAANAATA